MTPSSIGRTGGIRLRTFFPLIATALVLLPLALAGQATHTDPAGDQTLLGLGEEAAVRCRDAASDLLGMRAFAQDGALVLQLDVRDVGSSHVTCRGRNYPTEFMSLDAQLNPAPVCTEVALGSRSCSSAEGIAVGAWVMADAAGTTSCIRVRLLEGLTSECMGEATLEGSTYTWSIPLSGAVRVQNGDMRQYDLAGQSFVPRAYGNSYFTPTPPVPDLTLGLVSISDSIYVYGEDAAFTL